MDKISIIVPAYNSQDTIERCIKSIQNQTYKNLEIIVVNDGSTDNTERIVHNLSVDDNRIKLISIPNGGVSHARNTGIDNATGDYITFVDSDDYIDSIMYESLISAAKEHDAKIAHCSYKNVVDGEITNCIGNTGKIMVLSHEEALEKFLSGKLFNGGIWNKIYAKSLFDNVRIDETISIYEDVLVNFFLFDSISHSVYIDKSFYSYVSNSKSATHTAKAIDFAEQKVYVSEVIYNNSIGKSFEHVATKKLAVSLLDLYKAYCSATDEDVSAKKEKLKPRIKEYKMYYKSRNERIAYYLLLYFSAIYKTVYKIYSKYRVKQLDPIQ